jgi:two-component SAPR family response regulator
MGEVSGLGATSTFSGAVLRAELATDGLDSKNWLRDARSALEGGLGPTISVVEVEQAPDLRLIAGAAEWAERVVLSARVSGDSTPTIVLTAEKGSNARVLDAGADDCLGCPFDPEELRARIQAVLRRLGLPWMRRSDIAVNRATLCIRIGEVETRVSRKQLDLFVYLAARRERWVHSDEIIAAVSGAHHDPTTSLVRVQVHALRKALGTARACIRSDGHRSYMLTVPPDQTRLHRSP